MPRGVSALDEARLQGRLWTPAQIQSQLGLWLDAVNATPGVWRDASGFGNDVSQATAGSQPALAISINGLPCVRFASANSQFYARTSALSGFTTNAGMTFASAFRVSGGNGVFSEFSDNGVLNRTASFFFEASTIKMRAGGTSGDAVAASGIAGNRWRTACGDETLSRRRIWFDGTAGSVSTSTVTSYAASQVRIGALFNNSYYLNGDMGEIVVSASQLSDTDRQRLEGYLAWKWGSVDVLNATHPFKNRPPLIGG
jgi:hypothetical protein